jgi:hypothetical protein
VSADPAKAEAPSAGPVGGALADAASADAALRSADGTGADAPRADTPRAGARPAAPPTEAEKADAPSGLRAAAKLGVLALGLALAGWIVRTLGVAPGTDTGMAWVDTFIRGQGLWGEALFVAIGTAATAAGLPRQIVAFLGGYAFGAGEGIAWALLAQLLGCAASFGWAGRSGRAWAERRLAGRFGHRLRPSATALGQYLRRDARDPAPARRQQPRAQPAGGDRGHPPRALPRGLGDRLPAADPRLRAAGRRRRGGPDGPTRARRRALRRLDRAGAMAPAPRDTRGGAGDAVGASLRPSPRRSPPRPHGGGRVLPPFGENRSAPPRARKGSAGAPTRRDRPRRVRPSGPLRRQRPVGLQHLPAR